MSLALALTTGVVVTAIRGVEAMAVVVTVVVEVARVVAGSEDISQPGDLN